MSRIELAYKYEQENRPDKAIFEFEEAIKQNEADIGDYIELALLYFQCFDPGYSGFHNIPDSIIDLSFDRPFELLDAARLMFSPNDELEFWYLYLKCILRCDEVKNSKIEELANNGTTLIPYFYLYSAIDKGKYLKQATQLYEQLKVQKTAKSRYIISVMGLD